LAEITGVPDLLLRELEAETAVQVNPVTDTVTTTATQILKNDPKRLFWMLINLGTEVIYVGWDRLVSSTRGVPVAANGGFIQLYWKEDAMLVYHDAYAIAAAGSPRIYLVSLVTR